MLHFNELAVRDYKDHKDYYFSDTVNEAFPGVKNWFSNFAKSDVPIFYRDQETRYVEVAYQAAKNPDVIVSCDVSKFNVRYTFIHRTWLEVCFTIESPSLTKRLGGSKGIIKPRDDWDYVKLAAMDYFLRQKWSSDTLSFGRLLDAYKKSNNTIVEWNNWNDNVWGIPIISKKESVIPYQGRNALGLLLSLICQEADQFGDIDSGYKEANWIKGQETLIASLNNITDGGIKL